MRSPALARWFKSATVIETHELKAVLLSVLYFFLLFGSYSIIKPVRDAMGTVYGMADIEELFTGTFVASLIFAPLYAGLVSRLRLATFLPWVYAFIALTLLLLYALIDLTVNALALGIQIFGTGRIIGRFGVTTGLLLNPLIMVVAFLAVVFSPALVVLGSIQVIRRVAEYALARPTREMLFTVVDQESRYKAKNIIDTVIYRFGDLSSAWISAFILPFGVAGLAIFGVLVSMIWIPIAYRLGRQYENKRGEPDVLAPVHGREPDPAAS